VNTMFEKKIERQYSYCAVSRDGSRSIFNIVLATSLGDALKKVQKKFKKSKTRKITVQEHIQDGTDYEELGKAHGSTFRKCPDCGRIEERK